MSDLTDEDQEKIWQGFIARISMRIGEKYQMSLCNVKGSHHDIPLMSFDFQRYGLPLTEEEARRLMVSSLTDYLQAANEDKDLRSFVKRDLFEPNDVEMGIFSYDPVNQQGIFHPYIYAVTACRGKISYYTQDGDPLNFKSQKVEFYDDAVAILQKEKLR